MFTLIALNTANYDNHPGWLDRLGFIANMIHQAGADVACLTETRYSQLNPFNTYATQYWVNQSAQYPNVTPPPSPASMADQIAALLTALSGATWTVLTDIAMTYPNNSWEGLSILSRLPLSGHGHFTIPNGTDSNTRLTQYATATTAKGSQVTIYNTHYTLDEPTRIEDSQTIIARIQADAPPLFALVGDLNATPDEDCISALKTAGYVDLWAQLQGDQDGFSFPSQQPAKRIDYVWCGDNLANQATKIATTAQPFATESGTVYMSDHLGLVATFDLD